MPAFAVIASPREWMIASTREPPLRHALHKRALHGPERGKIGLEVGQRVRQEPAVGTRTALMDLEPIVQYREQECERRVHRQISDIDRQPDGVDELDSQAESMARPITATSTSEAGPASPRAREPNSNASSTSS